VTPRFIIQPQARTDLAEQSAFLAQDSLDVAVRFLDAAERAFADLAEMPGMGRAIDVLNPRLEGLRQWHIRGFERYQIYYRDTGGGIEVLRVLHGARDIQRILEEDRE
jgi:toxin ParE1/3/4